MGDDLGAVPIYGLANIGALICAMEYQSHQQGSPDDRHGCEI